MDRGLYLGTLKKTTAFNFMCRIVLRILEQKGNLSVVPLLRLLTLQHGRVLNIDFIIIELLEKKAFFDST